MKKKLNLNDLKIKSFVTDLDSGSVNTVKGGISGHHHTCQPAGEISIDPASDACYTDYSCRDTGSTSVLGG